MPQAQILESLPSLPKTLFRKFDDADLQIQQPNKKRKVGRFQTWRNKVYNWGPPKLSGKSMFIRF